MKLQVPRYFSLRQFLTAFLLYYFLVFPTGMILWLKHSPEWLNRQGLVTGNNIPESASDTAILRPKDPDSFGTTKVELIFPGSEQRNVGINNSFSSISRVAFYSLLTATIIGVVLGYPYKRYFKLLRRRKEVSKKLSGICKKHLLRTPIVYMGTFGLAFLFIHIYILVRMYQFVPEGTAEVERELFRQFFFISLTAAILVIIFLYSWQKHRVHLRYIEHIYEKDALLSRPFKRSPGRIRGRLWMSAGMTTLFPLSIVIFYLFLSLTTITELGITAINEEQARLLFGKYLDLFGHFPKTEMARNFFYVNAIDSILMLAGIFTGVFVSLIYLVFYVRWNTEDIVAPVKELLASMERTGKGQFGQFAMVRTNDEIGTLAEGYNMMTQRMKEYVEDISELNRTYSQFVPRQFLDILGRKDYSDIRLGDQIEGEMSVLFSDIRSFTSISEGMTPKESFDFINAYLGWMEPVIREHNGFIDKYIGDAIMAVFPEKADDALHAAIAMRNALDHFNHWAAESKGIRINTGIGIHTGKLMMGIVGTEGRLNGTVISDAVNLASRLEGLNKSYGSAIIISQNTFARLQNQGAFKVRSLGTANLRGKAESVGILEVLDGEPVHLRSQKEAYLPGFLKAMEAMQSGNLKEAAEAFREYLNQVPDDQAAVYFLHQCE